MSEPASRAPHGSSSQRHDSLEAALRVLEFPQVLELVATAAATELGAEKVRALRPIPEPDEAVEGLRWTEEMLGFRLRETEWTPPPIPDLRADLRRLAVEGASLSATSLMDIAVLLDSASRVRRVVLPVGPSAPRLASLAEGLADEPDIRARLERSFDEGGEVADGASARLKRIRRTLRAQRAALVERLERLARELPAHIQLPEASVTLRSGRYCIPIRREGRRDVGGIVHDESASRQTLFVEPPAAIEPMNEIRALELAEAREVRAVLEELTELVRPLRQALEEALERLVEFDSLYARATYALRHGGSRPELGAEGVRGLYRVVEGRHPILLASEEGAVGFSLELHPDETVLLVSGPNAGGKTVLLKAIGLLSAMAQSGIVPPVGPGTRLPVFRAFFAVIGDQQSIEASLSTFSAQVGNLKEILEQADAASLVLMDEVGSHTDPAEGGALAAVVLLQLARQAGLTVATTHLGELKSLAGESSRVVNASLQFDAARLQPTFVLRRDRPGRSYALEIAHHLGLPGKLVEQAKLRMSVTERSVDSLLSDLERREGELAVQLREAQRRLEEVERRETVLAAQEEAAKKKQAEWDGRQVEMEREARRKSERYLLSAREQVEEAIARLEARYAAASKEKQRQSVARERKEAASEARRSVERALRFTRERTPPRLRRHPDPEVSWEAGEEVRVRALNQIGRVKEVRGEQVVVESGGIRLTVNAHEVEPVEAAGLAAPGDPGADARPLFGPGEVESRPTIEARPAVDLRGLRVEEVERALVAALDGALLGDLPQLRIIHGKGTGALRQRVRELLQADGRIPFFRPGALDEGGTGVTVVEFQERGDR